MEQDTRVQSLERIKKSIANMIELPGNKNCSEDFVQGYNAVYRFCTGDAADKYIIEGGQIYHLYDRILVQYLEKFPTDYTLEKFVRFIDGYRHSNERVAKMLFFLSRYFIRVNIEVSNNNVQELKKLYFKRLFEALFQKQEQKIHTMFIEEMVQYSRDRKNLSVSESEKVHLEKKQKMLRVFIREYINITETAEKPKSLKKLCVRWACALIEKDPGASPSTSHYNLYDKLVAVDKLFKQKERSKKNLYRMIEDKIEDETMKGFIDTFVTVLLSRGISNKTHAELTPFYSFIDSTIKGKQMFINTVIVTILDIFKKTDKCIPILRLLIFINKHLRFMPRTLKSIRKPLELAFTRKLREALSAKDTAEFEKDLLQSIDKYIRVAAPPHMELSLFVANTPSTAASFWDGLYSGIKNRLVLGNSFVAEKKLILLTTRRIERFSDFELKRDLQVHRKIVEYIDISTLYKSLAIYDTSNFEEILLCARDIATSEMYFKKEKPEFSTNCCLLAYTRWNFPKMNIRIPCEVEEAWESVEEYCRQKGRKYLLSMCPSVSPVELEINGTTVTCDLVQGSILILLGKTGPKTRDEICFSLLLEESPEHTVTIKGKIQTLIDALLIEQKDETIYLLPAHASKALDVFVPDIGQAGASREQALAVPSRSAIEACIVRIVKENGEIAQAVLSEKVRNVFPVEDREVVFFISALCEKGFVTLTDQVLRYEP
ncbi:hypothetical protein NEDG_00610 [Nematocida displodere]|uniref:Cullin family profile domain-containing protein n=1 Tax=Nematocida displodere TaxID=1805483 RepID=A0A177EC14_9MICR|nr:hypothetical protein NEDG_00610 [Nematocida displodere]